jgi:hypothetical protein
MPDKRLRLAGLAAPLLLLASLPVEAAAPAEAAAPPQIELSIDPPGSATPLDDNEVCRAGKLSRGPESVETRLCLRAIKGQSLDMVVAIPVAGWSESFSLLDRPDVVIAYLSDSRFQDFWPLLLAFGGADGAELIAVALETRAARAAATPGGPAARDTLLSSLPDDSRAAVVEARILSRLGQTDAALERIDRAMPQPDRKGRFKDMRSFELVAMLMTRASTLRDAGRFDEALATYQQIEGNGAIEEGHRLNATVNRAALLAELGRGDDASGVIEPAALFYASRSNPGQVEGSMRQFDWIRACALHQVGRKAEAERLVADIFSAATPFSASFFVPAGESLESRYRWCIGDTEWVATKAAESLARPLPPVGVVAMLYGDGPPFPRHRQAMDIVKARLLQAAASSPLRAPPAGWADLLDREKRAAHVDKRGATPPGS